MLKPLIGHPFAAYRAIGGVALIEQYLHGQNGTNLKSLNTLVQDPRSDVRDAIRLAVQHTGDPQADKLNELFQTWQQAGSSRVQALAYQILPNLPTEMLLDKLKMLEAEAITGQPEVRKTVSKVLSIIATDGLADNILAVLLEWSSREEPDPGVIAGCLSKPWAAAYPEQSLDILTRLTARTGAQKRIRKALQSLARHGAESDVLSALEDWRTADDPLLREAGFDEKLNL